MPLQINHMSGFSMRLNMAIRQFLQGDAKQDFPPTQVYQLDQLYILFENGEASSYVKFPPHVSQSAPDLLVVTLADQVKHGIDPDPAVHLKQGVREFWLINQQVDPMTITIHKSEKPAQTFVAGETLQNSDVLPGFTYTV